MVWFKVDDRFYSHPKVTAISLAARGLWVTAGSWSGAHLTDGVVPGHVLASLGGSPELAEELVTAGLWRRTRGGYLFHEWAEDGDGTKRNPSKAEVEDERRKKAAAGRKGGLASGRTRRSKQGRSKTEASASARASPVVEPPTRPSPPSGGRGDARRSRGGGASPGGDSSAVDWHPFQPDPDNDGNTCAVAACGLPANNRRHREV